jgi:hypothetical protein
MVIKLESIEITPDDKGNFPPLPPLGNNGDDMDMGEDKVTSKDLKLIEEKLNSKIQFSEVKILGKIDNLETKIDSQSKILWWLMSIVSAGIVVPLVASIIKMIFSN